MRCNPHDRRITTFNYFSDERSIFSKTTEVFKENYYYMIVGDLSEGLKWAYTTAVALHTIWSIGIVSRVAGEFLENQLFIKLLYHKPRATSP